MPRNATRRHGNAIYSRLGALIPTRITRHADTMPANFPLFPSNEYSFRPSGINAFQRQRASRACTLVTVLAKRLDEKTFFPRPPPTFPGHAGHAGHADTAIITRCVSPRGLHRVNTRIVVFATLRRTILAPVSPQGSLTLRQMSLSSSLLLLSLSLSWIASPWLPARDDFRCYLIDFRHVGASRAYVILRKRVSSVQFLLHPQRLPASMPVSVSPRFV